MLRQETSQSLGYETFFEEGKIYYSLPRGKKGISMNL